MKSLKLFHVFALLIIVANAQGQDIFDAIKNNDLRTIRSIIESDPKIINVKNLNGWTPLYQACQNDVQIDMLKYLIENGADVNISDNFGFSPLHSLAVIGYGGGVALLLSNNADVNLKSFNKTTPFHFACHNGHVNIVKLMLAHGADVSAKNSDGDTPLNFASKSGSREILDLLLDSGAQYDGTGMKALLMLQESSRFGNDRFAKLIIEKEGSRLFEESIKNQWTVQDVVVGGSVELLKMLIDSKISINKGQDIYGWSLMHYACLKGNLDMIEFLVNSGIDINLRTKAGESAYNIAEKNKLPEVQNLLLKLGSSNNPIEFPELKGPYLSQQEPGIVPEIFAPGIISRPDFKELSITFPSELNEVFYYGTSSEKNQILHSRIINNKWTYPAEFDNSSVYPASEPFITFDGTKLFFSWRNPEYPFYG